MRETLVLLHGFGGTRHTWDLLAARLERRTLPAARARPARARRRRRRRRSGHLRRLRRARARAQPRALRAVRLLAGRADRPAGGAGRARAGCAARARVHDRRHRAMRPSGRSGARPTAGWPRSWSAFPTRASSSAGAPSRCSPRIRLRWRSSHARTSAATARTRSPVLCAASAPGRWSRCGSGWAS